MTLFRIFAITVLFAESAAATVVTLGASAQTYTLTGTGLNSKGAGTSRVTFGTCAYDGKNTTCTVSGPYTGLGSGGTYLLQLIYPGNGLSPLSAITSPPTSNLYSFSLTAGSLTSYLTPTGGSPIEFYDLSYSLFYDPATASCTGVSQCGVAAVGQSQGGVITGPVNGNLDATPVVTAVLSAGSYGGFNAIAPATWIEIYGNNLANTLSETWDTAFNGVNAPSALGGTTVTIAGQRAFIDFVSDHQVNVQVPSGIPSGKQTLIVTTAGGPSVGTSVTVNNVEPGLLAPPIFDLPVGQYVVALFPNGATYVLPPGLTNAVPTARAKPGDTIMLYGIGFGAVSPNINAGVIVQQSNSLSGLRISIGGAEANVQFAGLVQGLLGLYQFNVTVPNVPASDATPLTFTLNGTPGPQSLILAVGN